MLFENLKVFPTLVNVSLALTELAKTYNNFSWQGGSVLQTKLMILHCNTDERN